MNVSRTRDLTKAQFERAMILHGWHKGLFGYWEYGNTSVHPLIYSDHKPHRRENLAYMIREQNKIETEGNPQ